MTYAKPELKFDHDPRASSADCPATKCREAHEPQAPYREAPRISTFPLAYSENREVTTLRIPLDGIHWNSTVTADGSAVVIFNPPTELLEALGLVCVGEIARRQEAGDE